MERLNKKPVLIDINRKLIECGYGTNVNNAKMFPEKELERTLNLLEHSSIEYLGFWLDEERGAKRISDEYYQVFKVLLRLYLKELSE